MGMIDSQDKQQSAGYSTPTSTPSSPQNTQQEPAMPPRSQPKQSSNAFIPGTHTKIDTLPKPEENQAHSQPTTGYGQTSSQNVHFNKPDQQKQSQQQPKSRRFSFSSKTIFISLFIVSIIGTGAYIYSRKNPRVLDGTENIQETPVSVKIENGNVVVDEQVVVAKEDYPDTGIAGFMHADSAKDGEHICFESWPPSLNPTLYVANKSGFEITPIGSDFRNCTWIDGNRLVYEKRPVGINTADIFVYDIDTQTQTNLTEGKAEEGFTRQYKVTSLTEDRKSLECEFDQVSIVNGSKATGKCQINLEDNSYQDL